MFSSRVPGELEPNRLAREVARARAERRPLIDLTVTNPTVAGIAYPEGLLAALGDAAGFRYEPHPFGSTSARQAVSRDFARRSLAIPADNIVLTASTSEAYSLLFKLLCDPAGDTVLTPTPSYPLFEHLTRLDGVRTVPYRLEYHGRWLVDFDTLDAAWRTPKVRAVLAVSPNNPTGSALSIGETAALEDRCAAREAALILDEVFADYPIGEEIPCGAVTRCLTFRLGGLSKSAGLPQVKLGWIGIEGPPAVVASARERLELICDTYLSVSTPVQVAAPALIASGAVVREAIRERTQRNQAALRQLAASYPAIELLNADGGWTAVLRIPAVRSEEDLVLELLERDGVMVHPGFFFDFAREAYVVVSLLTEPAAFDEGVRRLLERADA